jgi:hypothetical protein
MLVLSLFACPLTLVAQPPAGAVALYPLDNNTGNDIGGSGYNATLTSTTATTNRFGTSNSAISFTAGSSTGTLPQGLVTAMQNDFTIAYWFKTTMTAPTSTNWYSGSAMVDAEVCGAVQDFGTALISGGKVAMGIGNPDITIISTSSYNDGAWHFVTGTRQASAGVITLYVDGTQVATASGTATTARTSPTFIGLGRNDCSATAVYTGNLDDIIAYGRALSSTEVGNLYTYYSATPLPLKWLSFTGQVSGDKVDLQWQTADVVNNDHFEIERSTDGNSYNAIGSLPNKTDQPNSSGGGSYHFTDNAPLKGVDLYRIRQVDIDGKYSFSTTVAVTVMPPAQGLYLQTNPVRNVVTLVNPQQKMIRSLQVVDASGRVLATITCNSSNSLISENAGGLNPGYYFLRVSMGDSMTTLRFIKL